MIATYPIIAAIILILDQLTKLIIRMNIQPNEKIYIIGEWFSITFVKNTGAAFSIFSGNKFVTVGMTSILVLACLIFIIYEIKDGGSKFLSYCLTFIFAGGVGNLIDRVAMGYVTDMFSFGDFPVFNIADISVTCGCLLTVVYILFLQKRKESEEVTETIAANEDKEKTDNE